MYYYPNDGDAISDPEYLGHVFIDRNLMLEEVIEILLINEKLREILAIRNPEQLIGLVYFKFLKKKKIRV